ncbi:MAG: ribonuclease HI [Oscillospiraceae bacterium]|nr:ribonuclease HI [Oscillospiraceae bacterium]
MGFIILHDIENKKIEIFTDGSCSGNPGPGGWAAILKYNDNKKIIYGSEKMTTNNRMEMFALIRALESLTETYELYIYSDSKYVIDSISKGWAKKWQANGWKRGRYSALNSDLWEILLNLLKKYKKVNLFWVRGHSGHPENEECDNLAVEAVKQLKSDMEVNSIGVLGENKSVSGRFQK